MNIDKENTIRELIGSLKMGQLAESGDLVRFVIALEHILDNYDLEREVAASWQDIVVEKMNPVHEGYKQLRDVHNNIVRPLGQSPIKKRSK